MSLHNYGYTDDLNTLPLARANPFTVTRIRIMRELDTRDRFGIPAPSLAELARAVGLASASNMAWNLAILREHGLVTWDTVAGPFDPMAPRTLRLTGKARQLLEPLANPKDVRA